MINAAIVGLGRWGQTLVASVQSKNRQGNSDRLRFAIAKAAASDGSVRDI